MAVYSTDATKHGLFRSSRLKSTDVGRIWDLIVRADTTPIAVDNGVAVKVGTPTHDGLQTRYATVAAVGDKVAIIGAPALVKTAFTTAQGDERNFYIPAGTVAKAYEVLPDAGEVFGVGQYQFTTVVAGAGKDVAVDNLVVVDGTGGWKELAAGTTVTTYGFVGRVYGFERGDNETIVLIECLKNENV